jgi:hypothetical protein
MYQLKFIDRDSSVGTSTDYRLDDRGSIPTKDNKLFSISQRPDQFWGQTSFQDNGCRVGRILGVKAAGKFEADHSLSLQPMSRKVKIYLCYPYLRVVVLNYLNARTILHLCL